MDSMDDEVVNAWRILHHQRAVVFLLLGLALLAASSVFAHWDNQAFEHACSARLAAGVIEFPDFPTYLRARLAIGAGLGMLALSATAAIIERIRTRRERRQFAPIVLR